jgi:hypothetical protein
MRVAKNAQEVALGTTEQISALTRMVRSLQSEVRLLRGEP